MPLDPGIDVDTDRLHDAQHLIVHGGLLLAHPIIGHDQEIAQYLKLRDDQLQLGIAFVIFAQFVSRKSSTCR